MYHSDELPYLFGAPQARDVATGQQMRADWISFVTHGRPGWDAAHSDGLGRRYGREIDQRPLFARERALFLSD